MPPDEQGLSKGHTFCGPDPVAQILSPISQPATRNRLEENGHQSNKSSTHLQIL